MSEVARALPFEYFHTLGVDILVVLGAFLLLTGWGLTKGKRGLLALLFALYPALLIATAFPWYAQVSFLSASAAPLALFGAATVGLCMVLRSYLSTTFASNGVLRFVEVTLLSVGSVGLAVSSAHVLGLAEVYSLSAPLERVFGGPLALFVWTLGPFVVLPVLVRA